MSGIRDDIQEAFEVQIDACEKLGSPFTAHILRIALTDMQSDGPYHAFVEDWQEPPIASGVALRLAGALHALVLTGLAPDLADVYPNAGGNGEPARLRAPLINAAHSHTDFIADFIKRPVQTNEIRRSCCLAPAFLEIAKWSGMALRLREIGSSAGLNLMWDRYSYDMGGTPWAVPDAPITLQTKWKGPQPIFDGMPEIHSRRGTDIHPIDIESEPAILRALSYIWPDQPERSANFRAAVTLARAMGIKVDRQDAAHWVPRQLEDRPEGVCTVIYHSVMWQYMPEATQNAISAAIEDKGRSSDTARPLAWLCFEPSEEYFPMHVAVRLWPGDTKHIFARCHPHGASLEWFGGLS